MIAFLLSPLGLRIIAGLGMALLVAGFVWSYNAKIRAAEAAKWEVKLKQCLVDKQTATDANVELKLHYEAFVMQHNAHVARLEQEQQRKLKERDRALAALGLRDKETQQEIDRLKALAGAAPLPKEESCEQAYATLRSLATDIVRDDRNETGK